MRRAKRRNIELLKKYRGSVYPRITISVLPLTESLTNQGRISFGSIVEVDEYVVPVAENHYISSEEVIPEFLKSFRETCERIRKGYITMWDTDVTKEDYFNKNY